MIDNINDLIKTYSLDQVVDDNSEVLKEHCVKIFSLYSSISSRLKRMNFDEPKAPLVDLASLATNNAVYEGLKDTAYYYLIADAINENEIQLPNIEQNTEVVEQSIDEDKKDLQEIISRELPQLSTRVKELSVPTELHNFINEQIKSKEEEQGIRGIIVEPLKTEDKQVKSTAEKRFVLLNDYGKVAYGPCSSGEICSIRRIIPIGYRVEEFNPNKEYSYKLQSKKELIRENDFSKKNDFNWITFIVIATLIATIVGIIKCYIL